MGLFSTALSAAAGPVAGTAMADIGNLFGMNMQNQFNQSELNQAEAYNTQMADSVYSRGVQDMKNAGLNPILAAGSGDPMATAPTMPSAPAGLGNNPNIGGSSVYNPAQELLNSAQVAKTLADTKVSLNNADMLDDKLALMDPEADLAAKSPKLFGMLQLIDDVGLNMNTPQGALEGVGAAGAAGVSGLFGGSSAKSQPGATADPSSAPSVAPGKAPFITRDPASGDAEINWSGFRNW